MASPMWAHVRTALAVGGLGAVAAAVGGACLDYVGEERPRCDQADSSSDGGVDCGANKASPSPPTGSGSGSGSASP